MAYIDLSFLLLLMIHYALMKKLVDMFYNVALFWDITGGLGLHNWRARMVCYSIFPCYNNGVGLSWNEQCKELPCFQKRMFPQVNYQIKLRIYHTYKMKAN